MQFLDGTLYVKAFRGRHGAFNVGRLVTDLGEFVIKDALLEELEEGGYGGTFGIGKIFLNGSTLPSGAVITELRARLDEVNFEDSSFLPKDAAVGIEQTDPVDEEQEAPTPAPAAPTKPVEQPPPEEAAKDPEPPAKVADESEASKDAEPDKGDEPPEDPGLQDLFGELYPLGDVVKLDPSIGRAELRKQTQALKDMGYRYAPTEQQWHLAA